MKTLALALALAPTLAHAGANERTILEGIAAIDAIADYCYEYVTIDEPLTVSTLYSKLATTDELNEAYERRYRETEANFIDLDHDALYPYCMGYVISIDPDGNLLNWISN